MWLANAMRQCIATCQHPLPFGASVEITRVGSHTLRLEVSGGNGCVEIDVATVSPETR